MFQEFKEHAVRAGLGTALCVMLPSETKYHILSAVESIPSVFGTPNMIEFSSTTNMNITNVKGKNSVETPEFTLPYNIDNINLMEKIKGQTCKFAIIDLDDFSGQTFSGEPSYRLGEVGTDSIKTIVMTVAVSDANDSLETDLYDLFQDTISFESNLPSVVELNGTTPKTIVVATTPSGATLTATSSASSVATANITTGTLTVTGVANGSCIVTVKATDSEYAGNERAIKVIVKGVAG